MKKAFGNKNITKSKHCLCGCGELVELTNNFIKGHENVGRIAWNKGKSFSEVSKLKMSQSHLGKEPANKIPIDLNVLYRLYVVETPNKLEKLVYNSIESLNIPYKRQVPMFGKFVVDALFPDKKLVLEVFGRYWHERPSIVKKDYSKKKYLEKCGYRVEEIWDYEIKQQGIQTVLKRVFQKYDLV